MIRERSLPIVDAFMLGDVKIVPHALAREVRDEWMVEAHPIKKRRRNWRVVKRCIDRPGAYRVGNTIYLHPDLFEAMKKKTNQ